MLEALSIAENRLEAALQESQRDILTHHEKWNGSGYPNQLSGEDIPPRVV
ncbi:hypothetical protein O9992_16820 [Vibrio lentus]|nr:hypothetical protein [Vibrio lentus]